MPLYCSIVHESKLVIVRGLGKVTKSDIDGYLAQTLRDDVKRYGKLILLGDSTMVLSREELDTIADGLVRYAAGEKPGPVAFVPGNPMNLDMIVLLKQRVGARPFSIFVNARDAAAWIESFVQPHLSSIAFEGWTSADQPGHTKVVGVELRHDGRSGDEVAGAQGRLLVKRDLHHAQSRCTGTGRACARQCSW